MIWGDPDLWKPPHFLLIDQLYAPQHPLPHHIHVAGNPRRPDAGIPSLPSETPEFREVSECLRHGESPDFHDLFVGFGAFQWGAELDGLKRKFPRTWGNPIYGPPIYIYTYIYTHYNYIYIYMYNYIYIYINKCVYIFGHSFG